MFEAALAKMIRAGVDFSEPMSFRAYCFDNNISPQNAPRFISVDSPALLQPELKEAKCMVFRLGAPEGERHTQFALAKSFNDWSDYFLMDDTIFRGAEPEMFIPMVPFRQLFPFSLLQRFTETSLVNLALASGLMAHALQLDDQTLPLATATGQSTFSFVFRPHERIAALWEHARGQVEIDSIFSARREGKETIFVIESKAGERLGSLGKHKLVYPVLALRQRVPKYMPIVPIYLRVTTEVDGYHFYFGECALGSDAADNPVLSTLEVVRRAHLVLRLSQ